MTRGVELQLPRRVIGMAQEVWHIMWAVEHCTVSPDTVPRRAGQEVSAHGSVRPAQLLRQDDPASTFLPSAEKATRTTLIDRAWTGFPGAEGRR